MLEPTKRIEFKKLRLAIARRMETSAQIPTVTLYSSTNVTQTMDFLQKLISLWRPYKIRPQYLHMVIAATVRSLIEIPYVNSHYVNNEILIYDRVNLGVAIAVPNGLIVPVIAEANKLRCYELVEETNNLAKISKTNRLTMKQTQTSTFTITSLSGFGIDHFSPLLNPPEIGILGLGRVLREGDDYLHGNFSMTFDHRAWDGAPASRFLQRIIQHLTHPKWMSSEQSISDIAELDTV